jgi:hypothetical protein
MLEALDFVVEALAELLVVLVLVRNVFNWYSGFIELTMTQNRRQ